MPLERRERKLNKNEANRGEKVKEWNKVILCQGCPPGTNIVVYAGRPSKTPTRSTWDRCRKCLQCLKPAHMYRCCVCDLVICADCVRLHQKIFRVPLVGITIVNTTVNLEIPTVFQQSKPKRRTKCTSVAKTDDDCLLDAAVEEAAQERKEQEKAIELSIPEVITAIERTEAVCPAGHNMDAYSTMEDRPRCDHCRADLWGAAFAGCKTCNIAICLACVLLLTGENICDDTASPSVSLSPAAPISTSN